MPEKTERDFARRLGRRQDGEREQAARENHLRFGRRRHFRRRSSLRDRSGLPIRVRHAEPPVPAGAGRKKSVQAAEEPDHHEDHQNRSENTPKPRAAVAAVRVIAAASAE